MVKLPGSVPAPLADARSLGPAPADERFEITVLRRRPPMSAAAPLALDGRLATRRYLTREEHAAAYGASEEDIDAVAAFAQRGGLSVVERCPARRSVYLSGTVDQVASAFGTSIERVEHGAGISRRRTAPIHVPPELAGIVQGVFGIEDTPIARPHFQIASQDPAGSPAGRPDADPEDGAADAAAAAGSFTAVDVARLYDFPAGVDGGRQCIAIIELGGGYRSADLKAYFKKLGLNTPKVTPVSVDGGKNSPSLPWGADAEVALDIEIAGAVAPGAAIAVYFAPNSEQGFIDAITSAVHDSVNKPSVISISWGAPESEWTAQALAAMNDAFEAAAALGVTVCCAAGDAGSGHRNPANGTPDGLAHAHFPGSSRFVLCCGGTRLVASGNAIASETVWDDEPATSATGGGVSDVFGLPGWQKDAHVPASVNAGAHVGRGVPDVAGNASPATGYQVCVDYLSFVVGGTSAVSPLWAGLAARLNQALGRPVGFLNPLLYGPVAGSGAFHDITSGNNGAYSAAPGWDACTGWGSPDGARLLAALSA
ncbi:protease pro-enzyme activation domain-containing protein [Massilia sp. 9096]|uniref:S53 family peptidase n=1 Tax=Massilia sp. 9096 TaxID=1500894 RepID=UPI00056C781C|nr:S53 family peptidase [Massilia sp. 9096]